MLLLLSQMDRGWLGPDGDSMLVQSLDQNLPRVLIVRVEVEDVPHHVGKTLVGKPLMREQRLN